MVWVEWLLLYSDRPCCLYSYGSPSGALQVRQLGVPHPMDDQIRMINLKSLGLGDVDDWRRRTHAMPYLPCDRCGNSLSVLANAQYGIFPSSAGRYSRSGFLGALPTRANLHPTGGKTSHYRLKFAPCFPQVERCSG